MVKYDRFIPYSTNRDLYEMSSDVGRSEYARELVEAMGLNGTRIFSFRSDAQPPRQYLPQPKPKPVRRSITCERMLDAPDIVDYFSLNLLDWGSGNVLAIALYNTVYLWDAFTKSTFELMTIEEEEGPITSVSWAPDGCLLAIGLNNSQVQLWDSAARRLVETLKGGHHSRVGSLAWKNDHILTTAGLDGKIINNDVRYDSHIVGTYRGHTDEVCGLKWSASGMRLASGCNDNMVHVWDASSTRRPLYSLKEHTSAVKALAWCPFHDNLLATGGGVSINFWNTRTGSSLNSLDTGSQVSSLLWSKNDQELLSSHGNQLTLWKYPSMVKMADLTTHKSPVLYTAQSPDGSTVASAAADERLGFWNVFRTPAKSPLSEPFSQG